MKLYELDCVLDDQSNVSLFTTNNVCIFRGNVLEMKESNFMHYTVDFLSTARDRFFITIKEANT